MRRCLFGPAPSTFRLEDLDSSESVLFDFHENHSLALSQSATWPELIQQMPQDWRPDIVALNFAYQSIPFQLFECPLPIIGLAPDWNLLWSNYRHVLSRCDLIFTDAPGVERLQQAGITHTQAANLFGLEAAAREGIGSLSSVERDIDLLFVGNCQPAVQQERLSWLGRLAGLSKKWKVVIETNVRGLEYWKLLKRAKIVFNRSVRGECNQRVFETIAAGALLLQEHDNLEVSQLLKVNREFVTYDSSNLEAVVEHYLSHDDERLAISEAACSRIGEFTYAAFWRKAIESVEAEWDSLKERAATRVAHGIGCRPKLEAGAWSAVMGGDIFELREALKEGPETANKANAAGLLARSPSEAVGCFSQALSLDPRHAVAGL